MHIHVRTYIISLSTLFSPDVTIGFELPTYSVDEDGGSVTVCAVVLDGGFQIPVMVRVNSMDGSATSIGIYTYIVYGVVLMKYGMALVV